TSTFTPPANSTRHRCAQQGHSSTPTTRLHHLASRSVDPRPPPFQLSVLDRRECHNALVASRRTRPALRLCPVPRHQLSRRRLHHRPRRFSPLARTSERTSEPTIRARN